MIIQQCSDEWIFKAVKPRDANTKNERIFFLSNNHAHSNKQGNIFCQFYDPV